MIIYCSGRHPLTCSNQKTADKIVRTCFQQISTDHPRSMWSFFLALRIHYSNHWQKMDHYCLGFGVSVPKVWSHPIQVSKDSWSVAEKKTTRPVLEYQPCIVDRWPLMFQRSWDMDQTYMYNICTYKLARMVVYLQNMITIGANLLRFDFPIPTWLSTLII